MRVRLAFSMLAVRSASMALGTDQRNVATDFVAHKPVVVEAVQLQRVTDGFLCEAMLSAPAPPEVRYANADALGARDAYAEARRKPLPHAGVARKASHPGRDLACLTRAMARQARTRP